MSNFEFCSTIVRYGYENLVHLLLENGAAVHLQNVEGDTCLHHAADYGQMECVQLYVFSSVSV